MKGISLLSALAASVVFTLSATADSGLTGRWLQSSKGQELVLQPKLKLTPHAAPGAGLSLGGSVGYGSATATVLATEPALAPVEREMVFTIEADGDFTWTINKRQAESASCTRSVFQERRGRAARTGGELVLAVSGGRETYSRSCGGSGGSALPAATERYSLKIAGGEMVLSSAGVSWRFRRA